MPYIPHLVKCPLFRGLKEQEIAVYRPASHQVSYEQGDTIMREGETGDTLLILIKGTVTISKKLTLLGDEEHDTKDKTFLTLSDDKRPFFGEMALLMEDSLRTATVTASTHCEMVVLEKEPFKQVCRENPAYGLQIMENIARNLAKNLERESKNVLKLTTAFSLVLED
jgi:CRP-like cAMP-binding protein